MSTGKCPDLYDCRFSSKELKALANLRLRVENAKLRAKLKVATEGLKEAEYYFMEIGAGAVFQFGDSRKYIQYENGLRAKEQHAAMTAVLKKVAVKA